MAGFAFSYLRDADFSWLADYSDTWTTYAQSLSDAKDGFDTTVARPVTDGRWKGKAADSAGQVCDEMSLLLRTRHVRATGIAAVLAQAYDGLLSAQGRLRTGILQAERDKLTVAEDGTVEAGEGGDADLAETYTGKLDAILAEARKADAAAAKAVFDLVPKEPGSLDEDELADLSGDLREGIHPAEPAEGMTPDQNAAWWSSLSPAEKYAYIYAYPEQIGGMDGLPASVRHEANMVTLRADAEDGNDRSHAKQLLERIEKSEFRPDGQRIYLLGYEPPGPHGSPDVKVIAAYGNPDTADHTAIYVPGTGTDYENLHVDLNRAKRLDAEAGRVSHDQVSTIMWLGYDAPDTLPGAASSDPAREGAPALRAFTEGLATAHDDSPSHTTVIGHSYGTEVIGTADALAGKGLAVDDVVALGSPGMGWESPSRDGGWRDGPLVDNVNDMHISGEHMWAGTAWTDPINILEPGGGLHGPADASFGGRRFSTGSAFGHGEYWDNGTEALTNQALIVTGQYDKVDTSIEYPK